MPQIESKENLILMPQQLAICQLPPSSAIPDWVLNSSFWSITRTSDEISLVVSQDSVPGDVLCEQDWRAFRFAGPLAFNQIGILEKAIQPLARAKVPIFVLSTFNTDYILIKAVQLDTAWAALRSAGYQLSEEPNTP